MKHFLIYLTIINALGFLLMLIDKQKARKKKWRISETKLLLTAVAGGSIGTLFGMYTFRHKTLHNKFTLGVPAILFGQILLVIGFIYLKQNTSF